MTSTPAGTFPPALPIPLLATPARGTFRVPGSKSITNRALILATLCSEPTRLLRPLVSEDTEVMIHSLRALGVTVEEHPEALLVHRPLSPGFFPVSQAELFVANSGTSMRFLTALVALGQGRFQLDGIPRMRERPIEDLLSALSQLGVHARSEYRNGCPPVVLEAAGLAGGTVRIRSDVSSQFLSALLMAATQASGDITIDIEGTLVSRPYVTMTIEMIRQFGGQVETPSDSQLRIPAPQPLTGPGSYTIEPDASAASYFLAAAAITGGEITIPDLGPGSLQGDVRFLEVMEAMGCETRMSPSDRSGEGASLTIRGAPLHGIDVDMNDISDTVMTLAVVACFADGPTTIRNVAHIRHKETDRLSALATELQRIGVVVEERADGMTIHPRPMHGAEIMTYNDHRMAMSFALLGLLVPGIVINNPVCVTKTYPGFFTDLDQLR